MNQSAEINRAKRRQQNDRRRKPSPIDVTTYQGRDNGSGYRTTIEADGGIAYKIYLNNAQPEPVPGLSIGGTIGKPGIIGGKPV
jgi:hypothetical protein